MCEYSELCKLKMQLIYRLSETVVQKIKYHSLNGKKDVVFLITKVVFLNVISISYYSRSLSNYLAFSLHISDFYLVFSYIHLCAYHVSFAIRKYVL